jgi:hypothetical protein
MMSDASSHPRPLGLLLVWLLVVAWRGAFADIRNIDKSCHPHCAGSSSFHLISEHLLWTAALRLRLRELLRAHYFDGNEGLVSLDPSVVSRRDGVRFTCVNGSLSPILQAYREAP